MKSSCYENRLILAPSIIGGNQANLEESLREIELSGSEWVHLDVMDGQFVPNVTFGATIVKALRSKTKLFFDVHLMLNNPDLHVQSFIDAGADSITLHLEPNYPVKKTLDLVRSKDCAVGLALNPLTQFEKVSPFLSFLDLILVMTVNPGFCGQEFMPECLEKVQALNAFKFKNGLDFRIEVDGGISLENAKSCILAGANTLVCGTSFFKSKNKEQFHKEILGI